jgi:hypothetical protein
MRLVTSLHARVFFCLGLALHVCIFSLFFCLHWSARLFCLAPLVFRVALESFGFLCMRAVYFLKFWRCAGFVPGLALLYGAGGKTLRESRRVNAAERFG